MVTKTHGSYCNNICEHLGEKVDWRAGVYRNGYKRCERCYIWLRHKGLFCPCCGRRLRTTPADKNKNKKYRNKMKHRANYRKYYQNNKDKVLTKNKRWIETHQDRYKHLKAVWSSLNKPKRRIYAKSYYYRHRKEVNAKARDKYQRDKIFANPTM